MTLAEGFNLHTFADAFRFLWNDHSLLTTKALEQLQLSAIAIGIAALIALPLGVWLGHIHRGSFFAINVSNLGRALPSLAVISVGLPVFGIGHTVVILALVVLAAPLMLTNSYVAVDGIDEDVVEAARGMGLAPWQVLVERRSAAGAAARSSRAFARRRSMSSRPRRSPASSAAARSATSSSTSRRTFSPASWARRFSCRCSRSRPTSRLRDCSGCSHRAVYATSIRASSRSKNRRPCSKRRRHDRTTQQGGWVL